MDNFMDKLSNRFHAGELIRANGEAEAKQMQSLKDANEQQAQVISEVRRLNLKTAEISEQISQMAAASIEKIEEYKAAIEAAGSGQGAQQAAVLPGCYGAGASAKRRAGTAFRSSPAVSPFISL